MSILYLSLFLLLRISSSFATETYSLEPKSCPIQGGTEIKITVKYSKTDSFALKNSSEVYVLLNNVYRPIDSFAIQAQVSDTDNSEYFIVKFITPAHSHIGVYKISLQDSYPRNPRTFVFETDLQLEYKNIKVNSIEPKKMLATGTKYLVIYGSHLDAGSLPRISIQYLRENKELIACKTESRYPDRINCSLAFEYISQIEEEIYNFNITIDNYSYRTKIDLRTNEPKIISIENGNITGDQKQIKVKGINLDLLPDFALQFSQKVKCNIKRTHLECDLDKSFLVDRELLAGKSLSVAFYSNDTKFCNQPNDLKLDFKPAQSSSNTFISIIAILVGLLVVAIIGLIVFLREYTKTK